MAFVAVISQHLFTLTFFGINKKLSNEQFVANAPEAVVNKEKEKLTNNLETIEKLKDSLSVFG